MGFLLPTARPTVNEIVALACNNPDRAIEFIRMRPETALPIALVLWEDDIDIDIAAEFPQIALNLYKNRPIVAKKLIERVPSVRVALCKKEHSLIELCLQLDPGLQEPLRKALWRVAKNKVRHNDRFSSKHNIAALRGFAMLFPERTVEFCTVMRYQPEVVVKVNPQYAREAINAIKDPVLIQRIAASVPDHIG
jgi:hypothetical protein